MSVMTFLTRTRGNPDTADRVGTQDILAYCYLAFGVLVIAVPVLWTLVSSFKPEEAIATFDTRIMPYDQIEREVEGVGTQSVWEWHRDGEPPLEVYKAGPTRKITPVAPLDDPEAIMEAPRAELKPSEEIRVATENYLDPLLQRGGQKFFNFPLLLWNTVFVTVVATVITLLINSMAAFALSKYQFKGRLTFTLLIVARVIIPAAATPTGVFLLRQYMLTIPDELLEAARMDAASEWRIFWRIVLPLSLPALSVLAILSTIWRWNDFLWPLIVLISDPAQHTIQIGLTTFSGEFDQDHHYILAMTVVSLIPVTLVFVWLQRFITTGIATTGLK